MKSRETLPFLLIFLFAVSGCVKHDLRPVVDDCSSSTVEITLQNIAAASSCEVPDGMVTVLASGGVPPYSFDMAELVSFDGHFNGVRSGSYTVSVHDAEGCEASLHNIVVNASNFSFEPQVVDDSDCLSGNGSISLTVTAGTPPFEYNFQNNGFTSVSAFSGLEPGDYQVVIRDSEGCSAHLSLTVGQGNTGVSWQTDILPLVEMKCALTGCHNGRSEVDLRIYDEAKAHAAEMKSLTQDGSMPFDGSLTQEQIDLIACWVDEGASNN
jgi:hypothetical protein